MPIEISSSEGAKQSPPQPVLMKPISGKLSRRQFWYWSLVIIAAAAAATVVLVSVLKPEDIQLNISKNKPIIKDQLPKGYMFASAKTGELPAGFPKELVLFKDANILRGARILDATGVKHIIVEYLAGQPSTDVANQYQTKLPALGWKLSGSPVTQGTLQVLNFTKDKAELTSIISFKSATSTQISLDFKQGGK